MEERRSLSPHKCHWDGDSAKIHLAELTMRIKYSKAIVALGFVLLSGPAAIGVFLGDGGIHDIDYMEDHLAVDYQLAGLETTVNILEMGHVAFLEAFGDSTVNLLGGSLEMAALSDNSQFNAYAGEMMLIHVFEDSRANIFGGSMEVLSVPDRGIATIHGSDFAIDGKSVGYVELSSVISLGIGVRLTGTLSNGDPLDVMCDIYGNGQIFLVPEPATVLLVGLGGLMLVKRGRR